MSDKFQDKYRIPSARLQNWDYGSNAIYFVTICTQGRELYFGEIADEKMVLSEIGEIANRFWNEIPNHFPFVELGEYVVMPNHVHGILIFNKPDDKRIHGCNLIVINRAEMPKLEIEMPNLGVSTGTNGGNETDQPNRTDAASQKWYSGTLGVIINQYKRVCTINARKIHSDFDWQSRFHDHIIRNEDSFQRISNYIVNNPVNWADDKFFMP
jgi:hypothetical protein